MQAPVVIVLGGPTGAVLPPTGPLPADAVVIGSDSGAGLALAHGLPVHHVVGDLDSLLPADLERAVAAGAQVHRHPADKDATDAELSVELAHRLRPGADLLVLGPGGGRLDLLLGDAALLAGPATLGRQVRALIGESVLTVVRAGEPTSVEGSVGAQVSILPVHGPAEGVTTRGVRWPLLDAHLAVGSTRALSNELVEARASVRCRAGTLLVVQPGTTSEVPEDRPGPYDPRIPSQRAH